MKRISTHFLLLLLLIGFVSCKSSHAVVNAEDKALENALLWKIEGHNIEKPSFLFGTIHIIPKEDYFLPKGFLSAFESVDQVYFEIDVDEMTDMSKMMGLMKKILMKDNKSLKDLLSDEDYKVVADHFKSLGMPILFLEKMKPMFLEVFAMSDMKPGDIQNGLMKSYEFELNELAKQSGKSVFGLESMDFQLSIFDSIPYEFQAKRLVETIKLGDQNSANLKQLVKTYKSMDISAMVAEVMDEDDGLKAFEDLMLNGRNKNWIPIIESAISMRSCLFAVGAAHLGGENGVIRLLEKQGYKLTAINPSM